MGLDEHIVALVDSDFDDCELERAIVESGGLRFEDTRSNPDRAAIFHRAVGAIVQYASIDRAFLDAAPQLKAIGTYGVGTDHIDVDAARERAIEVLPVRDYCSQEVADHTLALVLATLRGVVPLNAAVHRGNWPVPAEFGNLRVLADCTYAVVGFGHIGQAVARRVVAFGGRVRAYDPHISQERCTELGVEPVSLEEAFESDIVSLHLPLSEATRHTVNEALLGRLPQDAILVNVSRGETVDQEALAAAITSGKVTAALDVLHHEPPRVGEIDDLGAATIVTPHAAWFSANAERRVRESATSAVVQHVQQLLENTKGA